ncbi:hypothetical protein GIB67_000528, partial [Kingdonia uniflora]
TIFSLHTFFQCNNCHIYCSKSNRPRIFCYGDPECIIVTEVESFKQIGLQIDPD